jgi:hypothetical protein
MSDESPSIVKEYKEQEPERAEGTSSPVSVGIKETIRQGQEARIQSRLRIQSMSKLIYVQHS